MDDTVLKGRIDTGVSGLDNILSGGLPSGQMYLPGRNAPALARPPSRCSSYGRRSSLAKKLSTSHCPESKRELEASARSHGWENDDFEIAEFVPEEASLNEEQQYTVFHPSEVELATTITRLTTLVEKVRPTRLVIDSLSELRSSCSRHNALSAPTACAKAILCRPRHYCSCSLTTALLKDPICSCKAFVMVSFVSTEWARSYGTNRRQIEILKLRGSSFREGTHDYTIETGGVRIYPRLIANEHESKFQNERVKSGVDALDEMFGGGINRGSATLLIGPTGAGKSTLSIQYAHAAAKRGDRAIVYSFDEVIRTAIERAEALGIHVREEIAKGTLAMSQVDPAELSPGELMWQIRNDVENKDTRVVVIDSLNGFLNAMPGEKDLILQLHELIAFLNQKGVVTFLILTQHGLIGSMHAEIDVSYLADTVLLLRYFEAHGQIRQAVSVLKQRVGRHERTLREFSLKNEGISVGEPLTNFRGILTGIPDIADSSDSRKNEV